MDAERENPDIMLVEDNPADVYLFRTALADVSLPNRLNVFENGFEALGFLQQCASGHAPKPGLIVLDLNLPGMNGRQILHELEEHEQIADLPVAVFTSSMLESGIAADFPGLKVLFAAKTDSFDQLKTIVKQFETFSRGQ